MFSKQLKYSYLMYEYIKNSSQDYILGKEIVENMNIPKSWGIELLYSMVKSNLLGTVKGKGFYCIQQELNFWDFYLKVEVLEITNENVVCKFLTDEEHEYRNIIRSIGLKIQTEMMNIKI